MRLLVQTQKDKLDLMGAILQSTEVVVDTETNGLNSFNGDRIIGVSLYFPTTKDSFYVPVRHPDQYYKNVDFDWYKNLLGILADLDLMIFFNAKFDLHMLLADGMPLPKQILDVMLAAQLLNENEWLSHGKKEGAYTLKRLGKKYLGDWAGEGEDKLVEIAKSHGLNPKTEMWKIPEVNFVAEYAMLDVEITYKLLEYYWPHLEAWNQIELFKQRSEFVLKVIVRMEQNGLRIDVNQLKSLQANIEPRIAEIRYDFEQRAKQIGMFADDKIINLNSPKQILAFFSLIGYPIFSTNKAVLEYLDNEWANKLLEYRTLTKANGTYYTPYLNNMDPKGVIHPSFNAIGTVSGRLSSNFQQIPRKGKYDVKKVFIPRIGNVLVQTDYSQLELRLATFFAQDKRMLQMYEKGIDMHQFTADQLKVTRYQGKTANFSLLYGMGAKTAAARWGMDVLEATKIVNGWNKLYPAFRKASSRYKNLAESKRTPEGEPGGKFQFVRLFNGRVRHYQEFERYGYYDETRTAWNNLVQGTGAAVAEISILEVCKKYPDNLVFMPLLTVHDSIIYETSVELAGEVSKEVDYIMTDWPDFTPPMGVDTKWTDKSWYDLA